MGVISGYVTRRSSGQPVDRARVAAKLPGIGGGVTQDVYTDSRGHFVLTWNTASGYAEEVYVNGQVAARNVTQGTTNHFQIS